MDRRVIIGYRCAACDAQAVSVRDPEPGSRRTGGRVLVPHVRGCPVARQVAEARARAAQRRAA